jgi:hypothetical protein
LPGLKGDQINASGSVQRKIRVMCMPMIRGITSRLVSAKLIATAEIPSIAHRQEPRAALRQKRAMRPEPRQRCTHFAQEKYAQKIGRPLRFPTRERMTFVRMRSVDCSYTKESQRGQKPCANIVADVGTHHEQQRAAIDERSTTKVGAVNFIDCAQMPRMPATTEVFDDKQHDGVYGDPNDGAIELRRHHG